MDNVLPFKMKEEESKVEGYVNIYYSYDSWTEKETIQADSFGMPSEFPGFIALFKDDPEEVVCFIRADKVIKIELVKESIDD